MKKKIFRIVPIIALCFVIVLNMCSFMSYDSGDTLTDGSYRLVTPHLSPSINVVTIKTDSNGKVKNYYRHTVPDVFGIMQKKGSYESDKITYMNAALDCGLTYLSPNSTLYKGIGYSTANYVYYDDYGQEEYLTAKTACQVVVLDNKEQDEISFYIDDQVFRSDLTSNDWYKFELIPLWRPLTNGKYEAMSSTDYNMWVSFKIFVDGIWYEYNDYNYSYFNGCDYDLCDIIKKVIKWKDTDVDISSYKYIYIDELEIKYDFGTVYPLAFAYHSLMSDELDDVSDFLDYFSSYSKTYASDVGALLDYISSLEERIQELVSGADNDAAITLFFDGIYKTIYNVLTIFFNMNFFGVKLGTVVGLLLGAAVVIIILKVVL